MNDARFDDLLRLWQGAEASEAELRDLEDHLRADEACRRALVGSVLLDVHLHARYAPAAAPRRQRRSLEAVAALLVVAVSLAAAAAFLLRSDGSRVRSGEIRVAGVPATSLADGSAFEVPASGPAMLSLKDGSRLTLDASSAGRILGGARPAVQLERGGASVLATAGSEALRISTPAGVVSGTDVEFAVRIRHGLKPELAVAVTLGSLDVDSWGQRVLLLAGTTRTFGPPTPGDAGFAKLLDQAGLSLIEAIVRAGVPGDGVVVAAQIEDEDGKAVYSVELAKGTKLKDVAIDVNTGVILEEETEPGDRSSLVAAIQISLQAAIEAALQAVPGRAVDAEFEFEKGKAIAEIKILTLEGLREVKVDAVTGTILKGGRR